MAQGYLFFKTTWIGAIGRFWKQELLAVLANLQLAIALLLGIAVASVAGTVIEQGKPAIYYQTNYPESPAVLGFLTWKVLLTLGLDHVYRTGWFLALLVLFGASLLACTSTRQLPMLRAAQRWSYYQQPKRFERLALSTKIVGGELGVVLPLLKKQGYRVFQADQAIYACKGVIGRVGPIVVHISMVFILLGAMVAALGGFSATEVVPSGDTFKVEHIDSAGHFAQGHIPNTWHGRVNRFWIDYTPEGAISQFYSDISLLDAQEQELTRKTIRVNQPLRYQGITFYQTNWSIAKVQVQVNNSPILEVPVQPMQTVEGERLWLAWVPIKADQSEGLALVMSDLQGTLLVYGDQEEALATMRKGMATDVQGVRLKLIDVIGATGLEIKFDPGVPIIYTGFGLLMVGVLMCYVSHAQIWAWQQDECLWIGGRANRAQITFEQEILRVLAELHRAAQSKSATQTQIALKTDA
jgi:cytochrome c biogenesis protein